MRTKQDIMAEYVRDGLASASDGALSMLTVMNILEVLIDIRDLVHQGLHIAKLQTGCEEKIP
jgi:hypothetical protein